MTRMSEALAISLVSLLVFSVTVGVLWLAWFAYRGGLRDLAKRRAGRRNPPRD